MSSAIIARDGDIVRETVLLNGRGYFTASASSGEQPVLQTSGGATTQGQAPVTGVNSHQADMVENVSVPRSVTNASTVEASENERVPLS